MIHRVHALACLLVSSLVLVQCSSPPKDASTDAPESDLQTTESLAWVAIRDGAQLIDVRTAEEYAQGHLEGAVNIPHEKIQAGISALSVGKDDAIVLYCRSGRRSGLAQRTLIDLGYTNVLNAGGYEALLRAK